MVSCRASMEMASSTAIPTYRPKTKKPCFPLHPAQWPRGMRALQRKAPQGKNQIIGANEQGPDRACGCLLAYMTFEELTEQLASDVRRINRANMRPRPRSPALLEPRKRTPQSRWSASRALLSYVSLAASQYDGVEMARADPNRLQSISARTSLHARARAEVVCKATARLTAARTNR